MDELINLNVSVVNTCPNYVVCFLEVTVVIAVTSLIVLGNFLTLVVLVSTPSLRNSHGLFLSSLTLADFGTGLVSALTVYPAATFLGTVEAWPYGEVGCLVAAFCSQLFSSTSRLTLVLLSIERYIAVVFPLKYSQVITKKVVLVMLGTCWTIVAAVNLAALLELTGFTYVPEMYQCQPSFFGDPVVALVLIFCLAAPSFFIILATSVIVSRRLSRSARLRADMTTSSPKATASQEDSRKLSSPKTVKLFRMVRVMVMAVFVCWVPFFSVAIVSLITGTKAQQLIVFTAYWLLQSSSFINTIIYFLMNGSFRCRMREILSSITPNVFLGISYSRSSVFSCRIPIQPGLRPLERSGRVNRHSRYHADTKVSYGQ
ncbi:QRFP-like peptide receptor [Patiria miniata]|uniref:G-protein coupled receptors family 1 profile domain-containing protein n=1 Tax=Patiria miniata TaxID=46514 RepID=A0A913Z991_PATMI|nr:QRFP-like peptide receptor [Patiria miniata]